MRYLVLTRIHTANTQTPAYFDSINKIPDMILTAHKLGMAGLALTDHECLSGHVKWLLAEKELKEDGKIPQDFKCACGNEIYLVENRNNIEKYWHYILIAKNSDGHRALRELSSTAWFNSFSSKGLVRVPTEMKELEEIVKKYPNTLIATSACLGNFLDNRVIQLIKAEAKNDEDEIYQLKKEIDEYIRWNINLFHDDFYIEIAAGTSKEQKSFNKRIKSIAKCYNIKIVIGSDSHYLTEKERPIHKAYLNSKEGEREVDEFYWDAHMMSNEEAFNNISDLYNEKEFIEICNNSMEIYNKIETYNLFRNPIIPKVNVKDYPIKKFEFPVDCPTLNSLTLSKNIQERYWVNECINGLYEKNLFNDTYIKRLEIEADVIKTIGEKLDNCLFEYFNTFQHYIDLFWECGSIVGPGRGSSVCYLSNYLLGITQLDPIEWDLPYFRFLNKERIELPDIDTDLCPSKRKKIFNAIKEERGELNLIQVCTFGTEGTRSAIAAACFKKGTMVKTLNGEKPIEQITNKDMVYTTNGWESVISPTETNGTKLIHFKTRYSLDEELCCTPDHEILILPKNKHKGRTNGKWDREKALVYFPELINLKSSNKIYTRYYNYFKEIDPIWCKAEDIQKDDYALKRIDLEIEDLKTIHWKNEVFRKYGYGLPENIKINEDFCELIGIWLAEGSSNGQSISFTISKKEESLKKRILKLMWNVFQLDNFQIYERHDSLALNISYSSKQLISFFAQLFETDNLKTVNQWNKRIPTKLKKIDPKLQLQIFKGWFLGDGYARTPENGIRQSYEAKGTTVSKELAKDMVFVLNRNLLNPTVIKENRTGNRKKSYNIQLYSTKAKVLYEMKYKKDNFDDLLQFSLEDRYEMDIPVIYNGQLYLKQKMELFTAEDIDEKVFCLMTKSQNFTVNDIIVHNCRGYRSEEYPDGIEIETTQYLSSLIPVERGFLRSIHDSVYGNKEKGWAPIKQLVDELNKYPGLLEIIESISGLINKRGQHASGVIFYNNSPFETNALMRSPNGDLTTQFELHDSDKMGK